MNCIFCKIGNGEIESEKVFESDNTLAFLDNKPHAKGHTVVIPKKHALTVFELDNLSKLMNDVKETMQKIQTVLNPDGFNVGWNHNSAGGQVVPHLHIHIFPRYNSDGGGSMHSIITNPGSLSVQEVGKLFK
jgi:histidine triad (HIT) family protein